MAEVRLINNLKGVLFFLETPLLDFEICNRQLVKSVNLSQGRFFPWELACFGISYGNINDFFQRRTMKEGSMFYREHLEAIGMKEFDFDRYIMLNNGNNHLDNYWVRFENYGAQSFAELVHGDVSFGPVLGHGDAPLTAIRKKEDEEHRNTRKNDRR